MRSHCSYSTANWVCKTARIVYDVHVEFTCVHHVVLRRIPRRSTSSFHACFCLCCDSHTGTLHCIKCTYIVLIPKLIVFHHGNANTCVSRLARRKSHHTALSNAAVPSSECSHATVANSDCPMHCDFYIAHPGSNAPTVTPREPKLTNMGDLFG